MIGRKWFHAQIQWAVMEESKRGLLYWKESAYIFQSEDHEKAFSQALEEGRHHENVTKPGRHWIEVRLAKIVMLDCLGATLKDLLIPGDCEKPKEHLSFDHVFDPESTFPPPSF
jgi:hypothetical protein